MDNYLRIEGNQDKIPETVRAVLNAIIDANKEYIREINLEFEDIYIMKLKHDYIMVKFGGKVVEASSNHQDITYSRINHRLLYKNYTFGTAFIPKCNAFSRRLHVPGRPKFHYFAQEYIEGISLNKTGDKMEELTIRLLEFRDELALCESVVASCDKHSDTLETVQELQNHYSISKYNNIVELIPKSEAELPVMRHNNLYPEKVIYQESEDKLYIIGWDDSVFTHRMADEAILLLSGNKYIWKHMVYRDCLRLRLDILMEYWYKITINKGSKDIFDGIVSNVANNIPLEKWKYLLQ
jgi:hypothetical protein